MPLHRQAFDGDSLLEELPPPADEPQLSPGRQYWWDGAAWVDALTHPEGKKALDEEFKAPLIAPPISLPAPKSTIKLKKPDVAMPMMIADLPKQKEPDPVEVEKAKERELWAPVVIGYHPPDEAVKIQEPRFPWLEKIDQIGAGAIAVAVLLFWMPRAAGLAAIAVAIAAIVMTRGRPSKLALIALVLAVPELVFGTVHAHNVSAAAAHQAATLATLNKDLGDAARVEHIAHVYDYQYGGPGTLEKYGWEKPTDTKVEFVTVHRFSYCLRATVNGVTMTVHEDGLVGTTPCSS